MVVDNMEDEHENDVCLYFFIFCILNCADAHGCVPLSLLLSTMRVHTIILSERLDWEHAFQMVLYRCRDDFICQYIPSA